MAFPLPLSYIDIHSGSILFAVLKLFMGISEGLPNYRIQLAFLDFSLILCITFFIAASPLLRHFLITYLHSLIQEAFFSNTNLSDLSIVGTRDIFV